MDQWIINGITILVVVFMLNPIVSILLRSLKKKYRWIQGHDRITIDTRYPQSEWISWPKENRYVAFMLSIPAFFFMVLSTSVLIEDIVSGNIGNNEEWIFYGICPLIFWAVLSWLMFRSVYTRFRISPEGIERYVAWFKRKSYLWDEIVGIRHIDNFLNSSYLLIRTTKGRFWVSLDMVGASTLSSAILGKVPKDRWEKTERVLLVSAERPTTIPSRQERKRLRREFRKI